MSSNSPNLMLGGGTPVQTTQTVSANPNFNPTSTSLPGPVTSTQANSWFEAMAKAWGKVLDNQASEITDLSSQIGEGGQDQPSTVTLLTAASLKMQFLSTNSATSNNAVGQALETLGRKQ
ncbi:MAG TPA: hypothetical protein VGC30_01910 [Dokdonella sp.]